MKKNKTRSRTERTFFTNMSDNVENVCLILAGREEICCHTVRKRKIKSVNPVRADIRLFLKAKMVIPSTYLFVFVATTIQLI